MHDPRPRSERIRARLATGPVGHLVCGVADWAELMARYLLSRRRQDPLPADHDGRSVTPAA